MTELVESKIPKQNTVHLDHGVMEYVEPILNQRDQKVLIITCFTAVQPITDFQELLNISCDLQTLINEEAIIYTNM